MRTYLFTYQHDGADWQFELLARDTKDARARFAKLPFARFDGELIMKVPAALGPLARILALARNMIARPPSE